MRNNVKYSEDTLEIKTVVIGVGGLEIRRNGEKNYTVTRSTVMFGDVIVNITHPVTPKELSTIRRAVEIFEEIR